MANCQLTIDNASALGSSVLLLPALVVFVLVSSQTGISEYLRYLLPAFPFAFVWMGQVACLAERRPWTMGLFVVGAVLWMAVSSLSVYPHSMSYFNELAGGPRGGHRYLLGANIDCGQDVLYLKDWCQKHPEARPLQVLWRDSYSQDLFGIENVGEPPPGPSTPRVQPKELAGRSGPRELAQMTTPRLPWQAGPRPGWYACSIHRIHDPGGEYLYFLRFQPVAMAGYSMYIYDITPQEASRVRRELGLPELPLPDGILWKTDSSKQLAENKGEE